MPTISGTVKLDGAPVAGRVVRAYRRDTGALIGAITSSDGTPVPGDPHYDKVSLLLHFDGPEDSSPNPKTVTINTGSSLSSAAAFFGAAGLQVAGGGASLVSSPDFALPGDFTLECRFYVTQFSPSLASLFNIGTFSTGALFRVQAGTLELWINGTNTNVAATVAAGQWHTIAWSRKDGLVRVFLNGVLRGSVTNAGAIAAGPALVGVSSHNGNEFISGRIDELRLTKGEARYTADYTPAPAAFPNTAADTAVATGAYVIDTTYAGEVQVVCLDDAAGSVYNDLILRTTPV